MNKLSPEILATFVRQDGTTLPTTDSSIEYKPAALLGIGGGKDSIVAGELLKRSNVAVSGFVMATGEQQGQAQAVATIMGIKLYTIERRIDTKLLQLQEQPGAYAGHIPISLIFGLVGTTLAAALGMNTVIVANESSASIPRIISDHGAVNHQWSKSFVFEQKLQSYIYQNFTPDITYCSVIRQLTSVAVAKLFAHYPQYFEIFTSDNSVFRIDPAGRPAGRWSLESPKSLSSFILLAPWLSESDMLRIFERDFLQEGSLQGLFLELTGIQGEPPLDCVGTVDELVLSLNLLALQNKFASSYLMGIAKQSAVINPESDWKSMLQAMLELQPEQALPEALAIEVAGSLQAELAA